MNSTIIINDLKSSKLISITIMVIILISSLLLSTGVGVMASLMSSVDNMFEAAKTPHFMQMHVGEINQPRLEKFVNDMEDIESFQIAKFLNIDGTKIVLANESLSSSVQDNGMTTQNNEFDFLLDLEGNIIDAKPGELYVPIYYMMDMKLKTGDKAIIAGKEFTIEGFVRDS
ncbi:MAG: hypothetical protein GXZ11_02140 [Tissierellia bacterium]|nr:hypothetical protein [Tissierellia bacterium]